MDQYEQDLTPRTHPRSPPPASGLCRAVPGPLPLPTQFAWSGVYLRGLLQDGERKSIEPMVARVPWPAELLRYQRSRTSLATIRQPEPLGRTAGPPPLPHRDGSALRQSPGDLCHRRYRLPQARQALRRCATSILRPIGQEGQLPSRRHGPLRQSQRAFPRGACGCSCPSPGRAPRSDSRKPVSLRNTTPERTKGQIALELLDQVRGEELLPGNVVITDAGYGVSQPFREGLEQRELFYIAGVTAEMVVFTEEPRWDWPEGRPARAVPGSRPRLADDNPRPVSLKSLAECLPRHKVTWREGTKGKLSAKFAWVRVWPGQDWARRRLCRCRADLAVDRGAGRRPDPVRLLEFAGGHQPDPSGSALEEPLAGGARLPADEGRTGPESFRGPLVAWVSSPRLPGDVGLWFPGLGTD